MNATTTTTTTTNGDRSTASPFLNDYKLKFVLRRLLQTFLSGLLLKFDEDVEAPWFVYFLQIFIFVLPFVYGGVFILAADLSTFSRLYLSIIAGVMYFLFVFIFKIFFLFLSNRFHVRNEKKRFDKSKKNNSATTAATAPTHKSRQLSSTKASLFNDEQGYEFGSCCSSSTLYFLFPPLDFVVQLNSLGLAQISKQKLCRHLLRICFDSLLAGFVMLCSVNQLSIVYLQNYYSIGGSVCVFILSWCVVCMALYSLCIREPSEPAVYQPYDQFGVQHYYRSFYVICFQLIEIIYRLVQ